jgi:membrane peptidoglycan carboxypeptidase
VTHRNETPDPAAQKGARKADPQADSKAAGKAEKEPRSRWRRFLKWTGIATVLAIIAGVAAFFIAYAAIDIPDPNAEFKTETTQVYYSDGTTPLGTFAIQNREAVSLADVPDHVQQAVIAAEDRTFYSNNGLDLKGIIRAAWSNASTDSTQGASTITQQYVKVLYLTQERTLTRKAKEAFLSLKLQRQLSKEEILQGYLNTIYFGRGAYGIQAASQAFFEKDVDELNVKEGAALAAILNSPGNYDPANGKESREALKARYAYVLDGMEEAGDLEPGEAERMARRLPAFPTIETTNKFGGPKGFLMNMVERELRAAGYTESDIYGGGLDIVTTFDHQAQKSAVKAVREQKPDGLKQLHVAIASVEPGTGAVRALYGGPDYVSNSFNWATAGGQPGSSFKPFALAAALRDGGYTLSSVFDGSSPYYIDGEDKPIENQGDSGGSSYGPVSLLTATQESVNTAYVDLTLSMENGAAKVLKAARDAGIPKEVIDDIPEVPVVSLGFERVPTVDMANAYATFAAEGKQADWYVVQKVTDPSGEVLRDVSPQTERVFSADVASNVSAALEAVITSGTGAEYGPIICEAGGKTGTATATQLNKDTGEQETHVSSSWFVGYTPTLATAVMYVRGDGNDPLDGYMDTFYGGQYPARTWQSYMNGALEGTECKPMPEAAYLEETSDTDYTEPTYTEPTEEEPTEEPETIEPPPTKEPTQEPPTKEPTQEPPTQEPPTQEPPTDEPTTPPTEEPTEEPPPTLEPPDQPELPPPGGQD